jgi:hypothetical protein
MAIRTDFTAGEVLAAADLNDTFGSKLNLAGGKILQIVRATDATTRSTISATYVDASISVTITPQKSTSAILIIWSFNSVATGGTADSYFRISDNSNNAVSGAEGTRLTQVASPLIVGMTLIGYSTPATTSATTYKGRFRTDSGTALCDNGNSTGQMYAIEVSA